MKRNYQQPATSVVKVNSQTLLLDVSPEVGPNGVNATRVSYEPRPEEVWGNR
jgi:hypothetical protein